MKLSLYSLDRKLAESVEVSEITFSGPKGETQILPGHMGLVSQVQIGEIKYLESEKNKYRYLCVSHGFLRVVHDGIVLLGYTLEQPKEIDVERAVKAQKLAEERLKESFSDVSEFRKYELKLQRALVRQQVAKRTSHGP